MTALKKRILALAAGIATVASASAKIELPTLMSDNMVLQQQTDARLWGKANAGEKVTVKVSWDKSKYTTTADADGKWSLTVKTPEASREAQTITISGKDSKVSLTDVLIGEVWYCSGQSNMEIPLRGYNHQPINGALDVILTAREDKPIRMFTVEKGVSSTPVDSCGGHWGKHNPKEVADCSATAYFFADYLSEVLGDVPVGVIISVWGGTQVQAWMSRAAAEEAGLDVSLIDEPVDRSTPDVLLRPSVLYNSMAAPVLPYTVKGMLWYQGENNVYHPDEYERLMPMFVQCMRDGFGLGDIPFYYVQVAPCDTYGEPGKNLGKLRLVQAKLMEQVKNCGMVVTMDIGDPICIHPRNKKDVGKRLAYWALAKDYGMNDYVCSGPIFDHMVQDGSRALLYFRNTGGAVSPLEEWLDGFEAAGEDGVYHPARAMVELATGTLTVYCDEVKEIKKVRYGYRPYFEASLFDNFGLPATPFVTTGEVE